MAVIPKQIVMADGMVHGPFLVEQLVCQKPQMVSSKGLWFGYDPLNHSLPLILIQMTGIIFTTRLLFYFLKPLRQGMFSAQVIAGIVLGQSILGHNKAYKDIFLPIGGKIALQTLSHIGFVIHLFLLGVRIDPSIMRKAGSKEIFLGTTTFLVPFFIGGFTSHALSQSMNLPRNVRLGLNTIVSLNSLTSFPVITVVLAELNILNSELGRLATIVSMVCEAWSWMMAAVFSFLVKNEVVLNSWTLLWTAALFLSVAFVCRPLVLWLTEAETRKQEQIDDIPCFPVLLILLVLSFICEVIGLHAAFGAFWLGVAMPDGPPMGTSLAKKLDTFATTLLLPCYIVASGIQTDFFEVGDKYPYIIELVIIVTYFCKFSGTFGASMYCGLPLRDAFCLALIMCCKGLVEFSTCSMWRDAKFLNTECFILIILSLLLVTGVSRILIVYLYDPSQRYKTENKRTILHTRQRNVQLRLLACIHSAENVPTIVNLLEASNPTRFSPISIFTLHLMELKGCAHSILVPVHNLNKEDPSAIKSAQIVNAFQRFEQQHQGSVMAQHFTSVAPYSSMHDDICTLALDKKATLIIVSFHKQYAIDGSIGSMNSSIRNINQKVLGKAPCSVGILVDRGEMAGGKSILTGHIWYKIALLYLGGPDDTEALAFCIRMAEHPKVSVTVIHFKHKISNSQKENDLEKQLINDFRSQTSKKGKVQYIEEIVKDSVDTTQVIGSLGDAYDLVMVGRHHDHESSSLLSGLTEWSECPELGAVGDMLASSDFHFSVLVVHQQPGDTFSADNSYKLSITSPKSAYSSRVYPHFSLEEKYTSINVTRL